jgi:hypothetical protein
VGSLYAIKKWEPGTHFHEQKQGGDLIELTLKDSAIRLAIIEKYKRIVINRPDSVIILCFVCGGAKSVVMHVQASEARLPQLGPCRCDELPDLPVDINNVEKVLTTEGEVERMYVRLKGDNG